MCNQPYILIFLKDYVSYIYIHFDKYTISEYIPDQRCNQPASKALPS